MPKIGVCQVELMVHESRSLKEKRHVIRSLIDRVKNLFNVSIAELDALDSHRRAIIGFVAISNDRKHLNKILSKVIEFIENSHCAEVVDYELEMI